ncbi:MAG: hypothetical protein U1E73_13135 [Planctomycetota bacterium]
MRSPCPRLRLGVGGDRLGFALGLLEPLHRLVGSPGADEAQGEVGVDDAAPPVGDAAGPRRGEFELAELRRAQGDRLLQPRAVADVRHIGHAGRAAPGELEQLALRRWRGLGRRRRRVLRECE